MQNTKEQMRITWNMEINSQKLSSLCCPLLFLLSWYQSGNSTMRVQAHFIGHGPWVELIRVHGRWELGLHYRSTPCSEWNESNPPHLGVLVLFIDFPEGMVVITIWLDLKFTKPRFQSTKQPSRPSQSIGTLGAPIEMEYISSLGSLTSQLALRD